MSKAEEKEQEIPKEEKTGDELAQAKAKAAELYDQLLRLKAEFENFRKRVDREKADLALYAKTRTYLDLLPLYDVLLHAHERIQNGEAGDKIVEGLEKIFAEFNRLFEKEGIKGMDAQGKPYDPNRHEVIGTVEDGACEEDTVVHVLQRGFLLGDKVLRHARVRISKKPAAQEPSQEGKE